VKRDSKGDEEKDTIARGKVKTSRAMVGMRREARREIREMAVFNIGV
jgi:hypothetical protein